ncbi:MAG: Panacea domain-containing protein [Isosphaerales bacterium]
MDFQFDSLKTTQAAAILLTLEGRVMDRMRLLKLLYIIDREFLVERGRTLTGDKAVAMNYGPVLSHTYNLLSGKEHSPEDWDNHIRSVSKKVVLMGDPGRGELSTREVDKLNDVSERFRKISTAGLSAYTHEFPEWIKNFIPDTSRPIPWTDALISTCNTDRIKVYVERHEEQNLIDSLLANPAEAEVDAGA